MADEVYPMPSAVTDASFLEARGFPIGAGVSVQVESALLELTRAGDDYGWGVLCVHDEMRPEERQVHTMTDPWWCRLEGKFTARGEIRMSTVHAYSQDMVNMVRRLYDLPPVTLPTPRELPFRIVEGRIGIRPGQSGEIMALGCADWWPNKNRRYKAITLKTSDMREIIDLR